MTADTRRRVDGVGFVLAVVGLMAAVSSAGFQATHRTNVLDLVKDGPLALPMLGCFGSVALLAATRRRRGRAFATLWALGSFAATAVVRVRAGDAVAGLDAFLGATLAISFGACLTLLPRRQDVVTPSAGATGDG